MFRLSPLSYLWMLAAPLWAPVAWLIPYVIYIDELLSGLGGHFFIRGQLLLPSLMLWTAAVIIHLSLWTLARRADILAISLGLLAIGLPLVIIVFVGWLSMICDPKTCSVAPAQKTSLKAQWRSAPRWRSCHCPPGARPASLGSSTSFKNASAVHDTLTHNRSHGPCR